MDDGFVVPSEREAKIFPTVVSQSGDTLAQNYRVVSFRGRAMIEVHDPYPHFVPLHRERFDKMAYPLLGGVSRGRMGDVFAYLGNTAQDLTANEDLIGFGVSLAEARIEADTDIAFMHKHKPAVWNMRELAWEFGEEMSNCIWRSPWPRIGVEAGERVAFILSLAGGDVDVYDDIMQSIAPLVMAKKPDGVIWWVGDGANGKSTLMDALYKIFPGQLSSITVKRLTDGRDTPSLNGTLANIVKESSEGRIDDTEIYKSIGTHENFRVHKFHSQDDVEIRGNLHHIFSANTIPSFNDKGYSARRRTFIVPFNCRFESDPTFEERTFTPELFGQLISEMCKYAQRLKDQGYRYKWSAATLAAKADYDAEASNAEEYAKAIIKDGVVAFNSFSPVKMDYENWCAEMGYVPLGIGNLRRAMQALGFDKVSARDDDGVVKQYRLPGFDNKDFQPFSLGRPGLLTVAGFIRQPDETPPPEFEDEIKHEPVKSILNGKW